jgi:hypothetical protein
MRRLREVEAGRLLDRVPALTSLSIEMHEAPVDDRLNETRYTRRVVLEHASSLFEVRCSNPHCDEGVYELTRELIAALAAGKTHFEGSCACSGGGGAGGCSRVLRYVATATYAPRLDAPKPPALDAGAALPAHRAAPPLRPQRRGEKAA